MDQTLIIFVRNPVLGQVKSRLAKDIGAKSALELYRQMVFHTRNITSKLAVNKAVYYSDFVSRRDIWSQKSYSKWLQSGQDLGMRMHNSFKQCFAKGAQKVIIIGSDCVQLRTNIIEEAFNSLTNKDVVIGPSFDGGYYLLGMKQFFLHFFVNKQWGTDSVFSDTIADMISLDLSIHILPRLLDIDTVDDLRVWALDNENQHYYPNIQRS